MFKPLIGISICSALLLGACSRGDQTQANRAPAKKTGNGDGLPTNPIHDTPLPDESCEGQWLLAVKQQPSGSRFIYDSQFQSSLITKKVDRIETVTASSSEAISQTIAIDDALISQYASGLSKQVLTLSKPQFIGACQKSGGQPIAISGLGGDITVTGQVDDSVVINGQTIKVKRVSAQVSNVKYGSYTISADIVVYISSQFPALPLKQTITITQSSMALIKGMIIQEQLKSGLPIIK